MVPPFRKGSGGWVSVAAAANGDSVSSCKVAQTFLEGQLRKPSNAHVFFSIVLVWLPSNSWSYSLMC